MSSAWATRIKNATKYKKEWESTFHCDKLYEYYKGFQWKGKPGYSGTAPSGFSPYTLNLVYSSIEIKLANLLFKEPKFLLSPEPGNANWNQEMALTGAQIKQDVLNTLVKRTSAKFKANVKRAVLDSFFRFGVLEVGYAADWRNPLKTRPLFTNRDEEIDSSHGGKVEADEELPENERIFFKRIKASRFLVSSSDSEDLENCDWCGYHEFYFTEQLRKSKNIKYPKTSDPDAYSSDYSGINSSSTITDEVRQMLKEGEISQVYHIFDNVSKQRKLILPSGDIIFETPFERLPFPILRWDEPLEGFYPVPPVFHWLSSQDEINESREQMRSYRRRFTRKYQAVKGSIDDPELEKFTSGTDGEIVIVNRENAIQPIENPQLGSAIQTALVLSKEDFNIISGTSSEMRGQADRQTATQSKLIESRTQIRESNEQQGVKDFICLIGREALICAQENFSGVIWVQLTSDLGDQIGEEAQMTPAYQAIYVSQTIDGYEFSLVLDVINASSLAAGEEKQAFLEFLALINTYPQVALSPLLIRECAYRVGYRNEKVIREMQRVAQLNLLTQAATTGSGAQGAGGDGGNNPSNAGKTQLAQEQPNSVEQTDAQLENQLGV